MLDLLNTTETNNDTTSRLLDDHSTNVAASQSVTDRHKASPSNTAAKRAAIERELQDNPERSDREIGRIVGVDHKTVAAARARLGENPTANSPPTPTERRNMLINACEDFDRLYPPGPSETKAAEEAVDEAVASGKVSLAPPDDETGWAWSIRRQREIQCTAGPGGSVTIWQEGDQTIEVAAGNAVELARHILWAAGFKTVGIYTHLKGGLCEDLEDGYLAANYRRDE